MRNGYSAAQIRAAEAPLLERGVPLMIRAAQSLAEHCTSVLPVPEESRVLVLAGAGDNGGDATYAASFLASGGVHVQVLAVMGSLHDEAEAAARAEGAEILLSPDEVDVAALLAGADVVVDGILGIGAAESDSVVLREPVRGRVAAIRRALNEAPDPKPIVIACDVPTGIHPDDGSVPDPEATIPANLTVTFIGIKAGLLVEPGADFSGKVWLEPIGASQGLLGVTPTVSLP